MLRSILIGGSGTGDAFQFFLIMVGMLVVGITLLLMVGRRDDRRTKPHRRKGKANDKST